MAQLPVAAPMAQPIPDFDQAIITARQHVIDLQKESNAQDLAIAALAARMTAVESAPPSPPVATVPVDQAVITALSGRPRGAVVILQGPAPANAAIVVQMS